MKHIFKSFKCNWKNLKNSKERAIFQKFAEEGKFLIVLFTCKCKLLTLRLFIWDHNSTYFVLFTVAVFSSLLLFISLPWLPKVLDRITSKNESRPLETMLYADYVIIDQSKHYWAIYLHHLQAAFSVIMTALCVDSYFIIIIQNSISMFSVLG